MKIFLEKNINGIKILLFTILTGMLIVVLNYFVKPVWMEWNNYNTVQGFYEEPENTIETIFLGSSVTINGFTPTELFETHGICAYNMGTEQQPMLASYYWLEEVYRLHSKSLKTAVLDCSMLRRSPEIAFYRKAIDGMQFSSIKYHAVKDYTNDFKELLSYLVPLFSYHDRWASLTEDDFKKINNSTDRSLRGYHFQTSRWMDTMTYDTLAVPSYIVDNQIEPAQLNQESLWFLKKIIDFCNENGIQLLLMKTPAPSWTSFYHNAVASIAQEYEIDFLDFNFEPLIDEIEYNYAIDSIDGDHMNYYGASKLTAWFGEYLVRECGATDIRKEPKYAFMEEELAQYREGVRKIVQLNLENDPLTYLSIAMENTNYTVFVVAKDDGATSLTQQQRTGFAKLGLSKLSELKFNNAYLAVIEGGKVVFEQAKSPDEVGMENTMNNLVFPVEETENTLLGISYKGYLKDGTGYTLESNSLPLGNTVSCIIDEKEYAKNLRGLNIITYDNLEEKVVDSACFDTCATSKRDSGNIETVLSEQLSLGRKVTELSDDLKKLYLYNSRCARARETEYLKQKIGIDGLLDFLLAYWNNENVVIYMSAMDDASGALDDAARKAFCNIGLQQLSSLTYGDSYLAVVDEGNILFEKKDHEAFPIETDGIGFQLTSGGCESGNVSSIMIDGVEYSPAGRGINVVIYDKQLDMVTNCSSFDTNSVPVRISN